ncbi:hypothetical protein [Paraburkholderia silvatlantica]|uniref:TMhelix containing protein n=1 Tax=Paraburkholderia silvatlantica TaxID=321895 RepID=A0ABR6G074_9BURK|nr:hypothetical protein [Paraburkholderia silvatlantica]MBB2932698.1 hypothetical protein [Paraburkholderia silvatlantica]PVY21448.1 hypothetical protein C7411_13623 [Paraburkholderia silvatlantica]PXW26045.1 hypothetical protein C7413_13723 [Paraburkholderia silvatlantica]
MRTLIGAIVIAYAAYLTFAVLNVNKVAVEIQDCQSKLTAQLHSAPINASSTIEVLNTCQLLAKQVHVSIPQIK